MENLVNLNFWQGRRVFITGQTGFKGAWLTFWLSKLGAKITGFALPPSTIPNLYTLLDIQNLGHFVFSDLNDHAALRRLLEKAAPDIVIHMAAQALVRPSYEDPIGTFMANTIGTAALLDAARHSTTTRAILVVTTDKVYEPTPIPHPHHETDPLGAYDPYSASKAAAEIVVRSFRKSYFGTEQSQVRLATVRAGNVIGGGDWSIDRIVPDIIRGASSTTGKIFLRNPAAIRPWQHVFDVLRAYMMIAEKLYHHEAEMDGAWNIGPTQSDLITVEALTKRMVSALNRGTIHYIQHAHQPHEEAYLALDTEKAQRLLNWAPRFNIDQVIDMTAAWYKEWILNSDMREFSDRQIDAYMRLS